MQSKTEELVSEKHNEDEIRRSCLSSKSKLGYKSVERKKRKTEEILNTKKTYEYRKESYTHLNALDNKENV